MLAKYQRAVRAYRLAVLVLAGKHGEEFDAYSKKVERLHRIARSIRRKLELELFPPRWRDRLSKEAKLRSSDSD
ncbi:MAG TPA: hypothetical protein VKX39_13910 [Bryobacteraceae bacterium]|nr:hypothetical protein [Bryobacteraceae bacterium]